MDPTMTPRWDWTILDLDEVDSTNTQARRLFEDGRARVPTMVRARRQTQGRGRGDHAWWSDEGSLTITLALDASALGVGPTREPRLALAAAVAVVEAVAPFVPDAALGVRWPNDVESGGRKLSGILPERVGERGVLIGIGLNVRTRLDDTPEAIRRMAVSLEELRDAPLTDADFDGIAPAILARFEAAAESLARDDPALPRRWRELDALRGRLVAVRQGDHVLRAVAAGIDDQGA
jgi:BirA family biotin operon repressor/biotin-[acetyl-CoA-carboxylase] ligase